MDGAVKLPLRRVLHVQRPAVVLVGGGGTGAGRSESVLPRCAGAGDKHGSVDWGVRPQVDRVVPQVIGGEKPIGANLLLNTEVPLFQIGRLYIQRISGVSP